MNNILVEVYCAATLKSYDFWLPSNGIIKNIIEKLMDEIALYENNIQLFSEESSKSMILYHSNLKVVLNMQYTVVESGVMNGDKLILI